MTRVRSPERGRFSSEMDIVRNGELETTNYFFSIGESKNVLALTFSHDVDLQDSWWYHPREV
jgi:hypothetical protein